MKAMIFAAGLGTRLRPLTDDKPKALVEVGGMPLLEIAIRRLKWFGIGEIIVNVHHHGEQIEAFLEKRSFFGLEIAISDERDRLLNTGGGLKKASWFFDDGGPFLVMNTDVLTDLDLRAMYEAHRPAQALATLAVQRRKTSRYLLFNKARQLAGWRNKKTGVERWSRPEQEVQAYAFSGIHVINPALFDYFPDEAVFSIIDVYLEAAKTESILAYPHDDTFWQDVGKLSALERAERLVARLELAQC
jgi:NDP-sugar pyrophosphorylase family protein